MGEGRRLWGFGDRSSGCEWSWRRVFAWGESGGRVRDWWVNAGWRFGGAEGGEICRDDRLRRDGGPAGARFGRRAIVYEGVDRGGGHDELIPAGSAVKLRGLAPGANVSTMRMRPPQQGQTLDEAWVVGGSGSVALSPAPTSREG